MSSIKKGAKTTPIGIMSLVKRKLTCNPWTCWGHGLDFHIQFYCGTSQGPPPLPGKTKKYNTNHSKTWINECFLQPLQTVPEMGGLRPPASVSGWSLRPGSQFQYNKPHEGQRNKAAAYQQEWFHYRTIGQSLQHAHLSSTVWRRPSPYCRRI